MDRAATGERPGAPWRFTGRERELADVVERLRTGATVVLTGAAGVGKSALARSALSALADAGWSTDAVHATASTSDIPYGALAHLLPSTMPADVVNPVRWAVEELTAGRRPRRILLVDDAHQLDPASAAVVLHLAEHRLTAVLATIRDDEPATDAVGALRQRDPNRVLVVEPVDATDTRRILRSALAGEVEEQAAQRLWQLAEGNLLLLRELVLASRESGALVGPPWRLLAPVPVSDTPALAQLVDARVGRLDQTESDVLDFVALSEPLDLAALQSLCQPDAVERCQRRQLVTVSGVGDEAQVWLAHPIYGEAVRSGHRSLELSRRYRALVGALDGASEAPGQRLRLAIWQLEAGVAQDPAALLDAARIAWSAHDHQQAGKLASAAVEAGAGPDAAILLATLANYAGQVDRAAAALATVTSTRGLSARQRTELALTRASHLGMTGRVDRALAELDLAQQQVDDLELRQNLEVLKINFLGYAGDASRILESTSALLEAPPVTPELLAQVRHFHAGSLAMTGRFVEAQETTKAALETIASWRDGVPVIAAPLHMNWFNSALWAGDLTDAERAIESLSREASGGLGWVMADNAVRCERAQLLSARGQFADAASVAATPDPGPMAAACLAARAMALASAGDAARADQALDRADEMLGGPLAVMEAPLLVAGRMWVMAAAGDLDGALRTALQQAQQVNPVGFPAFAAGALYAAVRLGAARDVADRLIAMVAVMQGPFSALVGRHARAAADSDAAALTDVARGFEGLGTLPLAAEAAAQAADALAATLGPGSAEVRRASAFAAALASRCQGLDTPAVRRLRSPELSDRERQVARLAAAGRTSLQIADDLVLSVRTVENHLQHAYTKLGITGRTDLGGLV